MQLIMQHDNEIKLTEQCCELARATKDGKLS